MREHEVECEICGATFLTRGAVAKYCAECRPIAAKENKRRSDERLKASRRARTDGRYIIVGYDTRLVRGDEEDSVIPLKGRVMTKEIFRDLIQQLPAGVYVQKNGKKFITTNVYTLKEVTK